MLLSAKQVGAVSRAFALELRLFPGTAVELRPSINGAGPFGQPGPGYVLAPFASSVEERTRVVEGLVQGLADTGAIPKQALRNELQVGRCAGMASWWEQKSSLVFSKFNLFIIFVYFRTPNTIF